MRYRWLFIGIQLLLLLGAVWLYYRVDFDPLLDWGVYLLWLGTVTLVNRHIQRKNRRLATQMWALADALGYTAADLKRLAGKYGELDWAATRSGHLYLVPGAKTLAQVIAALKREQTMRELEAKYPPK